MNSEEFTNKNILFSLQLDNGQEICATSILQENEGIRAFNGFRKFDNKPISIKCFNLKSKKKEFLIESQILLQTMSLNE